MSFMNNVAQQVISYERWSHEWYLVKPREGGWKVVSLVSIKFVSWIITDSWSSWAIQFVTHTLREKSYHSWWKISFMNGAAQQDISPQNTHSRQTSTSVTSTSITRTCQVWMSHVKYMSHILIRKVVLLVWTSRMNESYERVTLPTLPRMDVRCERVMSNTWVIPTYEYVTQLVWMSHVTHTHANRCQIWMSRVKCMSHVNVRQRHATRMNASRFPHPREWVSHSNESCQMYYHVFYQIYAKYHQHTKIHINMQKSHINVRKVRSTYKNSYHTYERIVSPTLIHTRRNTRFW